MTHADDTRTLADFNQNSTAHLDRLAESGGVEVLTVDGAAKGVVMVPHVFDDLIDRAERAETAASIGLADAAAGRTRPAKQAIGALAADLGLDLNPRRS